MTFFGVHLLGLTTENLHKLILSVGFVVAILVARYVLLALVRLVTGQHPNQRVVFWTRQITSLITTALVVIALVSIWFDNPARYGPALGIFSAGIAFALQKVITSFAAYLMIVRGKTFNVGERITMGGVRGDVIALGFFQTSILEMGEPPSVHQQAEPATWVRARQYTGRIVTVTNDKMFDTPVYNYTRDFPFIWDEIRVPVPYGADRARAERILLDAAAKYTDDIRRISEADRKRMEEKYFIALDDLAPRVYYRLTDNWVEMTLRFIVQEHGIRDVKDAMSRMIIDELERAHIQIASGTYDIVGLPPLRLDAGSVGDALAAAQAIREGKDDATRAR